jgi:tryptophan synthase, alpha subunit
MNRIEARFSALRRERRTALIPYITAGDPAGGVTVPLMRTLVEAGADAIELGVPFSDPMADGPVIQAACERALAQGVNLRQVLELVGEFRKDDSHTPVVLMGYLNPVEVMGYKTFADAARRAGVDGVLTVDLPPEDGHDLVEALYTYAIDPIFLLAPTTSAARATRICARARGFVYYVSLKGVTGANRLDVSAVAEKLRAIRVITDLPIGVGFGIRDAEAAARVASVADAVIVGSALVKRVGALAGTPERIYQEVPALLASMRRAMDLALAAPESE